MQKSRRKIVSLQGNLDSGTSARIIVLENVTYKVTYYSIVSGTSGTITPPTNSTFNSDEFGASGNCILSKIDGFNKPTFISPTTVSGVVVAASLNTTTGAWIASGTYADSNVALIYSLKIKAVDYHNLTYANIIETININQNSVGYYFGVASGTNNYSVTISDISTLTDGLPIIVRFQNAMTLDNPTLNVNGIGAYPIVNFGNSSMFAEPNPDIKNNQIHDLSFDITNSVWQLKTVTNNIQNNV